MAQVSWVAYDEDLANSAHSVGIDHEQLITRVLNLGLRYHAEFIRP